MTNNDPMTVPLELPLEDLVWLRSFLCQERDAAAVHVIDQERETMTRIIDEICRVVNIADAHDALARRIAKLEN